MEKYIGRIDELGKISISKDIMNKIGIFPLENVEILVKKREIVIRSFSPILKKKYVIKDVIDEFANSINHNVMITDLNNIIHISNNNTNIINKKISNDLKFSILRRENIFEKHIKRLKVTNNIEINTQYIINSIVSKGTVVGLLIIYDEFNDIDIVDYKISTAVANFIGKYVE